MLFKDKTSIPALVNQSLNLYEKGDYENAEKLCIKILKQDSSNHTAWINLGNIRFLQRDFKAAIKAYKKADSFCENNVLAKANLANVYLEEKNYSAACKYAKQALNLDEKNLLACNVYATSCLATENFSEAIKFFSLATKLDSSDAWNYNYLSQAYEKKGNYLEAVQAAWQALKIEPNNNSHHLNFAYLLYDMTLENKMDEAKEYARLWLQDFPQNPIAFHVGNALCGTQNIERANKGYLVDTFDVFAPDFDAVLKKLDYKVPAYIKEYLTEFYGEKNHQKLYVLDAGCGTGLCGEEIKKVLPKSLVYGVDISEKMLSEAQGKNIYFNLALVDLAEDFYPSDSFFDLIVAGDVFTYFGELDSVFAKLHFALKKNGRIIFSVSENNLNNKDKFLHVSGRFLHSENYIKRLLKKSGFQLEKSEKKHLRFEGEKDVLGFVVSAIKI